MRNIMKVFGETKAGKKIGVKPIPNTTLVEICFDSGGKLPKEFQGMWTATQAKSIIELYVQGLNKEEKPKGKAKEES